MSDTAHRLWLGTAALGRWGNADRAECVALIDRALAGGITTIDTAESYSEGDAEEVVGAALKGRRDSVRIATKFGYFAPDVGPGQTFDASAMRGRLEASLRRLGTDRIDLYQLHRVDPAGRFDDVLCELHSFVREGKVVAIGSSMCRADLLVDVQWRARELGVTRFTSEQAPFSIFTREVERAVCDACLRHDVDLVTFAPLNGGWLSGQYRVDRPVSPQSRAATFTKRPEKFDFGRPEVQRKLTIADRLAEVADAAGCTMSRLALAWVLGQRAVTATIIGPRTSDQLDGLLRASTTRLDRDVLDAIDAIVPPGTTVDHADINAYDSLAVRDAWHRGRDEPGDLDDAVTTDAVSTGGAL